MGPETNVGARMRWAIIGAVGVFGCSAVTVGCSSENGPASAAATTHAATTHAAATSAAPATSSAPATSAATGAPTASATSTAAAAADSSGCPEGMVVVPYATKFCMNKTEVTVAQYRQCVDGQKCHYTKPANAMCNWLDQSKGNHPMNCVGRTQAEEYCTAHGGRLPSVEEWEFASRDGEQRQYVWATAQDPQRAAEDNLWCWSGKTKRTGTCEVGSFPAGATKSGLLDMAGNLAEWATGGDVEEKSKTCGRAWDAVEGWKAMEKCPGGYFAEAQVPVIGFRCVTPAK